MRGNVRWRAFLMVAAPGIVYVCLAASAPEYGVKAAFLCKFAAYIRWPPPSGTPNGPPNGGRASDAFRIGVLGRDPFGPSLEEIARHEVVQGRGIQIRALSRTEEALDCEVVFISGSENAELGRILAVLRGAPVLTVSDLDRFAEQGGMIGFVTTEDHHIRFDINRVAIERAGLRASSQLLQLARIVEERR